MENKNNYLWIGIVIVAIIVITVIFTSNLNDNSSNSVTCNSPYIKVGTECCLDKDHNDICDKDEKSTQTPAQKVNDESESYCGDGICSYEEGQCSMDSHYEAKCSDDCGHNCPAYLGVSKGFSEMSATSGTYYCSGYNEDNCIDFENNNFRLIWSSNPYKYTTHGISTLLKNEGEGQAKDIESSFKCYSGNTLVMDQDGDTYKGVRVEDYFYGNIEKRQRLGILYAVYPPETYEWYFPYQLDFEIENMESGFDLTCDLIISSNDPIWSNIQVIKVSFVK